VDPGLVAAAVAVVFLVVDLTRLGRSVVAALAVPPARGPLVPVDFARPGVLI